MRNSSSAAMRLRVKLTMISGQGAEGRTHVSPEVAVAPGERREVVEVIDDAPALGASVIDEAGSPASDDVFLARRKAAVRKVCLLGRDEPLLRRFVARHAGLAAVGDAGQADLLIANGVDPPADKPALVVDPPSSPPGWRRGGKLEAIVLDKLNVAPDPIMAYVDLSGVAVRRVQPWVPIAASWSESLAHDGRGAFIVKPAAAAGGVRRVCVAFDLAETNTNLGTEPPKLVIFLANVVEYLSPGVGGGVSFVSQAPIRAAANPDWKPVAGAQVGRGPLPWPGIYRDSAGEMHAVSLTGLRAAQPQQSPAAAVAKLPLPQPLYDRRGVPLWPILAAVAAVLWLLGWAARVR